MKCLLPCIARAGALCAVVWGCATPAQAQTQPLNDTGQTACFDLNNGIAPCDSATVSNLGVVPHQDGRYGRDAAGMAKLGGGAAGFDLSCVRFDGIVVNTSSCTTSLAPNTGSSPSGTPSTDWACTKDNVTGLTWSLQSQARMSWADAGTANASDNTALRCGHNDWRLPTRRELWGLVHKGAGSAPRIDTNYFPSTEILGYWSADAYAPRQSLAWFVDFNTGVPVAASKNETARVRLVRGGP